MEQMKTSGAMYGVVPHQSVMLFLPGLKRQERPKSVSSSGELMSFVE